jgi:signal transduction histidine kinase
VHLPGLLADVIRRAEQQAGAHDIQVRSKVDADLPSVTGDQRRLRVVFDNIVSNALKYTPGGGQVTVSSRRSAANGNGRGPTVSISVTDTGPGVPPGFRTRIFDKFFRLEHQQPEGHPHPRGAGIGLYMCRQIVELHGGQIACADAPGDRGACITVELPIGSNSVEATVNESVAKLSHGDG